MTDTSTGDTTTGTTATDTDTTATDTDTAATDTDTTDTDTTGDTDTDTETGGGLCGDGVLDQGETCDDGPNNGDNNACKLDCTPNICGDALVGPGETCDDGPDNGDMNACKADCTLNVCGDGAVGPGELCDEGVNNGDNNACKVDCTPNVCGDALVGPGEGCDDGNDVDADECTNACALPTCGDGIASVSEECDDGNMDDTDVCTNACTNAACGDEIVQPVNGEACDDGPGNGDQADCTGSCNLAACGDGLVHDQGAGSEQCDNGDDNGPGKACNAECVLNICGDGDQGPEEACDDGDLEGGDGCNALCQLEVCGDSKTDPGEACDDGKNGDQDDGCTDLCTLPACGDGFEQPNTGETCDLGGANSDTGACTFGCKDAECGDSFVQAGVEQCDEGVANNDNSKACKVDCTENFCGDGFVEAGIEECDDGNVNDLDACSNVCKAAACNDGIKNGQETDVDCGGSTCEICPTVVLLASGTGAQTGSFGGHFTEAAGWVLQPLGGISSEGTDVAMTTTDVGVGLLRHVQAGNPQNNQLQYVTWNKGVWSPRAQLNNAVTGRWPSIDAATDTAQAAFRGEDGLHHYAAFNNGVWGPIEPIADAKGTPPGDIVALADNASFLYRDDVTADMQFSNRTAGMWSVPQFLSPFMSGTIPPNLVPLTAGNAELLGLWSRSGSLIRYAQRTNGVWGGGNDVPNVTTTSRPGVVALPGGFVVIVYRDALGKFQGKGFAAIPNLWTDSFPMPGEPNITNSPAITLGVGSKNAEIVYISGGQLWHARAEVDVMNLTLNITPPVLIPGSVAVQRVALATSK